MNAVKKAFPSNSKSIEQLFTQNGEFRSLCEEYSFCLQHLLKYSKELTEKRDDLEQYEYLFKELSKELRDYIERFEKPDE
jgi:DNA repair ATPase RecN